jgi:hypothetical protein
MIIKYYFNCFKKNYIENIVYPHNYSILSTSLIRNNLNEEQVENLNNYTINYWNNMMSYKRKKYWIKHFIEKNLEKKILQ